MSPSSTRSAARPIVMAGYTNWGGALAQSAVADYSEPAWITAGIDSAMGGHDLDGGADIDFSVYLEDNHDEAVHDPTVDQDLRVYIVSTCTKFPDTQKQVRELVEYNGVAQCYPWQIGGCGGDGNSN